MSLAATVAGNTVSILQNSFQFNDASNFLSTCAFSVQDSAGTTHLQNGMPVVVTDSVKGLVFAGFVDQGDEDKLIPNSNIVTAVTCKDNHWLALKRRCTRDYQNMAAGDIVLDMLSSYLAAEGVTANYAYKRVTTNTDWSSGATLTNTSATLNVGDGDLELSTAGSDTTKTFATTSDWTTGATLTSIDAGATGQTANQINLQAYSAIKFTGTNVGNLGNCYAYWEVGTYTAITIASGDNLTYDVWVSSTSPAIQAAVDLTFTDGYTLRDFNSQNMSDQNAIHAHPGSDLTGFADDQWYHRFIDLTAVAGKQIAYVTIVFEGDAGGDYTAYFRNIRHNNSGGTSRHTYFDSTANTYTPASQTIESNYLVSANGYFNLHTSSVTVYDRIGTWTSPAISVDAAKIVKSSLLSWQSFVPTGIIPATITGSNAPAVPTGTALAFFTSIDDTGTWQPAPFKAAIPNLAPGFKVASRNIYVQAVLAITSPSPEISPIVTKAQTTVTSSWVQTKTDSITICKTSGDFNTGNYSATSYYTAQNNSLYFDTADSGVSLTGYWEGFDTLTGTTPNVTTYGTNSPVAYTDHRQLHLQCGGSANDARLEFTASPASSFQSFTAQISFSFDDITREEGCGLVYRTTGWQNNNDTYAYTAMMVCNAGGGSVANSGTPQIQLGRGTNSNVGAGTYTGIATANLPFTPVNGNTYTLKVVANGNNHKVYLDDVKWIDSNDSTYNFVGGIAPRFYNNTGATHAGTFDNFGIEASVASPISGTWDNGSGISLGSGIGTAGNSIVAWDAAIPTGCALLTETSINGGSTWQTATSGAAIPNLGPGTNTTGVSVQIRFTLTSTYPSVTPVLKGWYIWITTQTNASGTRVSPALSLANVGRAGDTLLSVNSLIPTNTTLGLDISTNGSSWTDLTDAATTAYSAALPTATIFTQPDPYLDFFPTNTSANYTQTNFAGGGGGTWTWDTANNRLKATQTTSVNALLRYISNSRKDGYVEADFNKSDSGGLVVRAVDTSNAYYISIADASAASNANTVQLKKIVAGSISNVGSAAAISFVRGDYHRFRLDAQGTAIKVYMDNTQIISQTDSSISGAGKTGFLAGINNGDKIQAYSFRAQQYGDNVTSMSLYTRQRLASTDPTVTPQLTDLTLAVRNPNIQSGITIPTTNYAGIGTNMFQVAQAFDDLAKQSTYAWYIGNQGADNLQMFFHATSARPAPWFLYSGGSGATNGTGGNILAVTRPKVSRPDMLYRNRQTIDGGFDTTTLIHEQRIGDGVTQAWTMTYPLAAVPTITLTSPAVSLSAVGETVGVQGVDTGKDFYYQTGNNTISQDLSETPPAKTDTLDFYYYGQIPVRVTRNNTNGTGTYAGTVGQTQLAAIDGTSGIVEDYQSNPDLNKDAATAEADALLVQYGQLGTTLTVLTNQWGLAPGQLASVSMAEFGIANQQYVITNIQTTVQQTVAGANSNVIDGLLYTWMVTMTNGPILGSWLNLFARMLQGSSL